MDYLLALDREIFLKLNSFHTSWLDQIMMFFSSTTAWVPLYLLLLYLLVRLYRHDTWLVLAAIAITIALADQVTSSLMKPLFERLRPSHEPSLDGLVHLVGNYKGGRYGFASSHAANTFGLAMLMWWMLKRYRPWIGLLFAWAVVVGYTRVYLGVHYPGDILAGQLIGFLAALVAWYLFLAAKARIEKKRGLRKQA